VGSFKNFHTTLLLTMCAILGLFNTHFDIVRGLELMRARGNDGSDTKPLSYGSVGHTLHALVGHISQPLVREGNVLVANCEIYNWQELAQEYNLSAQNDADLLLRLLNTVGVKKTLPLLDGVFAFIYATPSQVWVARDLLGIKPVWYSAENGFCVASEKRALEVYNLNTVFELHPRHLLEYSVEKNELTRHVQSFVLPPEQEVSRADALIRVRELLQIAIRKRVANAKMGVLFSGGLDSLIIAYLLARENVPFTCYVVGMKGSKDILHAKRAAKARGLSLVSVEVSEDDIKTALTKIIPLIQDTNVVKAGVGLVTYFASKRAHEDGCKVLFSGLGADELFAGYARHTRAKKVNLDCYSDLLKLFEKNTYRDDVLSMHNTTELRFPFLDKALVQYALSLPSALKIRDGKNKQVLRDVSRALGIAEEFSEEKKRAAQYGSGFDVFIAKQSTKTKSHYLKQFYPRPNARLAALVSGGKDSIAALHLMYNQNYEITCLATLESENKDSFMFHTPNTHLVQLQACALGIPLVVATTKGEKEKELLDLKLLLEKAQKQYAIEGVITGALYSNYQRTRIEAVCEELGLKVFSPLWHVNQYDYMKSLFKQGYAITISSVAAEGFDKNWIGKILTRADVEKLKTLQQRVGVNVAGEGGEYESLVLDAPLFKTKLVLKEFKTESSGQYAHRMVHARVVSEDKHHLS